MLLLCTQEAASQDKFGYFLYRKRIAQFIEKALAVHYPLSPSDKRLRQMVKTLLALKLFRPPSYQDIGYSSKAAQVISQLNLFLERGEPLPLYHVFLECLTWE